MVLSFTCYGQMWMHWRAALNKYEISNNIHIFCSMSFTVNVTAHHDIWSNSEFRMDEDKKKMKTNSLNMFELQICIKIKLIFSINLIEWIIKISSKCNYKWQTNAFKPPSNYIFSMAFSLNSLPIENNYVISFNLAIINTSYELRTKRPNCHSIQNGIKGHCTTMLILWSNQMNIISNMY